MKTTINEPERLMISARKKTYLKKWAYIVLTSILSLILFCPFLLMLVTSLKTMGEIQSPEFIWIPEKWMFSNFVEAMRMGNWPVYFANTFFITIVTVAISLTLNTLAGYSFARLNFRGRGFLFALALVGLMIPEQVIMVPVFIKIKEIPLFGGNDIWGNGGQGWLNTYWGLIMPYVANPFIIFLSRQFFLGFPKSLDEAAKIDGLSLFRIFLQIYIPLSLPLFATIIILKSVYTWNQYTWPLIITNADNMKTVQLALSLYRSEFSTQWNYLMAATTMIIIPPLMLFLFLQKYYIRGIVTSGVKG